MRTNVPVSVLDQWLSEIYHKEFERLKRIAIRIIHNEIVAEEILGECLAKLAIELSYDGNKFNSIEHAKAFLVVIIRNKCISWLRKKRPVTVGELKEEIGQVDPYLMHNLEKRDLMLHLQSLIAQLTPKLQQVATLLFKEGLTNEEAALQLQLSKESLLVYKNRALRKLQEKALAGNYRLTS
ncbi:sigma-70 family RNA polymerase sigma factor [Paraflavitalea sp. CAU 1676]|uniref:RNA polymerase sigma factor n=1 Tax=Paraflavitalea sp. CAU 1676 TaxID=3032598 RepID=UPI0023D99C19|nr:sigma-70 family RNA polymerase sigma factor [Paraflavitalea sp. CAU 1676]MDF2190488.1 sigma-70 family RNA polymerase sigma factor [Paraflavitalea sp. CAU 1676]